MLPIAMCLFPVGVSNLLVRVKNERGVLRTNGGGTREHGGFIGFAVEIRIPILFEFTANLFDFVRRRSPLDCCVDKVCRERSFSMFVLFHCSFHSFPDADS